MSYYTYILKSKTQNRYYVGSTGDLEERLRKHNLGQVTSTKKYSPYIVVYYETFEARRQSYKREMEIKSYKGGNAFKKLIASNNFSGIV